MKIHSTVEGEFKAFIFGKKLGQGATRKVYEYNPSHIDYVVKYEYMARSFHNIMEWNIWHKVKEIPELEPWFAPCLHISESGSFLLQARTYPIRELPKNVPSFLDDVETRNFGEYQGRVVCHDYAINRLLDIGLRDWTTVET